MVPFEMGWCYYFWLNLQKNNTATMGVKKRTKCVGYHKKYAHHPTQRRPSEFQKKIIICPVSRPRLVKSAQQQLIVINASECPDSGMHVTRLLAPSYYLGW